jgi:hypothetical protein
MIFTGEPVAWVPPPVEVEDPDEPVVLVVDDVPDLFEDEQAASPPVSAAARTTVLETR